MKEIIKKILKKLKILKIQSTLKKLNKKIRVFLDRDLFDIMHGTDTTGGLKQRTIFKGEEGGDVEYLIYYASGLTSRVKSAFKKLLEIDSNIKNYTFIDLGSGKGKVLMMAEKFGFHDIIGVEISPELNAAARDNLVKFKSKKIKIVEHDATTFSIPDRQVVIYIYNSFEKPVLEKVLFNIEASFFRNNRNGYLVYIDPRRIEDKSAIKLNENKYTLLYEDKNVLNSYHIYKIG